MMAEALPPRNSCEALLILVAGERRRRRRSPAFAYPRGAAGPPSERRGPDHPEQDQDRRSDELAGMELDVGTEPIGDQKPSDAGPDQAPGVAAAPLEETASGERQQRDRQQPVEQRLTVEQAQVVEQQDRPESEDRQPDHQAGREWASVQVHDHALERGPRRA
jgi:hypothetical protein